jgi:ADP-ribosylglycohydrolase
VSAPSYTDRVLGCLLGGAVGDALGASVEFMSMREIIAAFGEAGIREPAPAYGRVGAITDDTQLTLFTAEGALRALAPGAGDPSSVIHRALLRWLYTQGERSPVLGEPDGWLVERRELFTRRAPGATCLAALRATRRLGEAAQNDSKGCGAIMRVAPIGLVGAARGESGRWGGVAQTFDVACGCARATHGHPDSTFAAGVFALAIAKLAEGASLSDAIAHGRQQLDGEPLAARVLAAVDAAEGLARSEAPSDPEIVASLGEGWVAEEALAIALFCALRASDFAQGVRLAVNHGGDSDSTGSLAGQLLGTLWGADAIPATWRDQLELRAVIEAIAEDLGATATGRSLPVQRAYPGW